MTSLISHSHIFVLRKVCSVTNPMNNSLNLNIVRAMVLQTRTIFPGENSSLHKQNRKTSGKFSVLFPHEFLIAGWKKFSPHFYMDNSSLSNCGVCVNSPIFMAKIYPINWNMLSKSISHKNIPELTPLLTF